MQQHRGGNMKSRLLELALGALICVGFGCSPQRAEPKKIDPNSLYARIGELNGMARAVDAMVNHVLGNKVILENKQLLMRAKPENVPGLKVQITNLLSSMTGGPETYSGRSMKDAHRNMGITEAQWAAFMMECAIGLDEAKVAAREKQEILDLFTSMKKDIVEAP
jgi:hemoglobin